MAAMKAKKIFNIALNALIIIITLIVVIDLAYAIYARVSNDKLPVMFGFSKVVVSGESMEPTLSGNDMVIALRQRGGYEVGDIIIFDGGNRLIIHRIIRIEDDGRYITQGDNPITNPTPDPHIIYDEQVFGKQIIRIRGAGRAAEYMQRWGIILIPLCVGIYVYVTAVKGKRKSEGEKPD